MDVRKMDFKGLLMEAFQSDVPAEWQMYARQSVFSILGRRAVIRLQN
jgi:hypothetical protein